jgi:Xylose isomerase-like TIM barrel
MQEEVSVSRRTALRCGLGATLAAAAAAPIIQDGRAIAMSHWNAKPKICIFAKPIQELTYGEIANFLSKHPVDGLEATVREGGQVLPKLVQEQLPRLQEALAKKARDFLILATNINTADSREAEDILGTAAKLGIRYFRMGYYRYKLDQPILPQQERFAKHAQQLAQLCKEMKMTALYQNHAGQDYLGAAVLDLVQLLNGISTEHMAIALDIRHTTVEATTSWPLLYAAAKPQLGGVFVKDAIVDRGKVLDVDLGQGTAAKKLFEMMKQDGLPAVLSLHTEQIDHADPKLQEQRIAAISRDVATLQSWL